MLTKRQRELQQEKMARSLIEDERALELDLERRRQRKLRDEEEQQKLLKAKREAKVKPLSKKREPKPSDYSEISSGKKITYKVIVKTSERVGAQTEASIWIQLFGANGKTKLIKLVKSQTKKVAFQRGNKDVFDINAYDVGKLEAINVGHAQLEIKYAWYADYIIVEDHLNNRAFKFEPNDWFGDGSKDKRSMRFLREPTSTILREEFAKRSRDISNNQNKLFSSSSSSSRDSTPDSRKKEEGRKKSSTPIQSKTGNKKLSSSSSLK